MFCLMTRTEINFLDEKDKLLKKPKRKIFFISKTLVSLLIIFIILLIFFGINIISSGENLAKTLGNLSLWQQIKHLIGSEDKKLAGEEEDRINILLLGMGGEGHEGPYLSDTIILASFKPSTKQVALISIPRDLYVPIPGYGWRKINNANAFGEVTQPGEGSKFASQVIGNVFGLPIHYYIRIDFAGFVKIIDDLGGVTINVENTLDDEYYPVKGKESATTSERFEHLYIAKGQKHLAGEMALKYVRSRQAKGIEGSDFARSQRQQKVLLAVKEKTLTFSTLINPYKINRLTNTLSQHLKTNLQIWEIIRLFQLGKEGKYEDIINRVFDDSPNGPLYSTINGGGAFILSPKAGDFSELQDIVQNIFGAGGTNQQKVKRIEIQNGTKINGLAFRTSQYLQSLGYEVIKIKNAPTQDYQKTVIYNLTGTEENLQNITALAKLIAAEVSLILPEWLTSTTSPATSPNADILIILGLDQQN